MGPCRAVQTIFMALEAKCFLALTPQFFQKAVTDSTQANWCGCGQCSLAYRKTEQNESKETLTNGVQRFLTKAMKLFLKGKESSHELCWGNLTFMGTRMQGEACWCSAGFLMFMRSSSYGDSSHPIYLIQDLPHRPAQRLVSKVILDPVTLTIITIIPLNLNIVKIVFLIPSLPFFLPFSPHFLPSSFLR